MSIMGEAKAASETAAKRAAASVRDHGAELAAGLHEGAAKLASGAVDATRERIKTVIADFSAALPILKLAGYAVSEVAVEIGVPPKIIATFARAQAVGEQEVEAMLKQHEDAPLASMLVRALVNAQKLQDSVSISGLRPMGLAVHIGVPPSVIVKFG